MFGVWVGPEDSSPLDRVMVEGERSAIIACVLTCQDYSFTGNYE